MTTTPKLEWQIVANSVKDFSGINMSHGRTIPDIDDLLARDHVKESKLIRAEVISVVLYTGPMVSA